MQRGFDNVCVSIFTKNARTPCNMAERAGSDLPRCHFLPLCWIYWRATLRRAAIWSCSVCVCVCLTLCLYEMENLCRDLSCIFHVPRHHLSVHPFQLPQQHHHFGVTGNAGETNKKDAVDFGLCINM